MDDLHSLEELGSEDLPLLFPLQPSEAEKISIAVS
jgi:hypothetical protein